LIPWSKNNSRKPFPNLRKLLGVRHAHVEWQRDSNSCKKYRTIYWIIDDDKYSNRIVAGGSCR